MRINTMKFWIIWRKMRKLKRNDNVEGNWKEILYGKKFLTEKDAIKIREAIKDFRKKF